MSEQFSHPDSPVRHSYPLHAKDDGFMAAVSLCMQTLPLIGIRLACLVGFTIASLVWFTIVAFISGGLSSATGSENVGFFALAIGLGIPGAFYFWFKKYVLYILKAAHIAVLTELIVNGKLPEGVNQIEHGKNIVKNQFLEVNMMFVLDSIVTGVVNSFNATMNWVANLLPIPGLNNVMGIVNRILQNATTFIDETIFSYSLARQDENKWRSARDGLIYYGQNWQPVLKTAVWSLILEYVLVFVGFLVLLVPVAGLSYILPEAISGWLFLVALLLAFNIRAAVLHPIFLTMVSLTFHKNIQGQEINPEVDAMMTKASDKFVELKDKASAWVDSTRGKSTQPEAVSS